MYAAMECESVEISGFLQIMKLWKFSSPEVDPDIHDVTSKDIQCKAARGMSS